MTEFEQYRQCMAALKAAGVPPELIREIRLDIARTKRAELVALLEERYQLPREARRWMRNRHRTIREVLGFRQAIRERAPRELIVRSGESQVSIWPAPIARRRRRQALARLRRSPRGDPDPGDLQRENAADCSRRQDCLSGIADVHFRGCADFLPRNLVEVKAACCALPVRWA